MRDLDNKYLKLEGSTGYMEPLSKTSAKEDILTIFEATHQAWKKTQQIERKQICQIRQHRIFMTFLLCFYIYMNLE
jgi:hypothetical protein